MQCCSSEKYDPPINAIYNAISRCDTNSSQYSVMIVVSLRSIGLKISVLLCNIKLTRYDSSSQNLIRALICHQKREINLFPPFSLKSYYHFRFLCEFIMQMNAYDVYLVKIVGKTCMCA